MMLVRIMVVPLLVLVSSISAMALQFIPEKDTFRTYEGIEVTVYNDSSDWITFSMPGGIYAVNLETGFVHQFISLAIEYELWPGMLVELGLGAAIPMPEGDYELIIRYEVYNGDGNPMRESVFFSIENPVAKETISAGQLKARYRIE